MKDLKEKVAYLQGLADGMELGDSKEGKVISGMLSLLEELTAKVESIEEMQDDVEEYLEELDSDLADVEELIFCEDDEEDEEEGCSCCDDDFIDVECPNCHEVVCFDPAILDEDDLIEVTCPVCDAVVFTNDEEEFDPQIISFDPEDEEEE